MLGCCRALQELPSLSVAQFVGRDLYQPNAPCQPLRRPGCLPMQSHVCLAVRCPSGGAGSAGAAHRPALPAAQQRPFCTDTRHGSCGGTCARTALSSLAQPGGHAQSTGSRGRGELSSSRLLGPCNCVLGIMGCRSPSDALRLCGGRLCTRSAAYLQCSTEATATSRQAMLRSDGGACSTQMHSSYMPLRCSC